MLRFACFSHFGGCCRLGFAAGRVFLPLALVFAGVISAAAQPPGSIPPQSAFAGQNAVPSASPPAGGTSARPSWPRREPAGTEALRSSALPPNRTNAGNLPARPVSTPRRLSRSKTPSPSPATAEEPSPASQTTDWKKSLSTVAGALGIVLGGFVLLVVLLRQFQPPGMRALPRDAFEVLGRASLGGKHSLVLIRLGTKAALLSVRGEEVQTVLEIDDPDQVAHLAGLCQQGRQESATAAFRRTLQELAADPAVAVPEYRSSSSSRR